MEVEITAMVSRTRARTYEVPISYYGRTYEEGKKIAFSDGLSALWYIFFYNLIARWSKRRRRYIQSINEWLSERDTPDKTQRTDAVVRDEHARHRVAPVSNR